MINISEVLETNKMIEQENLDVRTITMGISLLDCADKDLNTTCDKIYHKITTLAQNLVLLRFHSLVHHVVKYRLIMLR